MTNQWQRWKGIMKCYPFEEKRLAKWQPPYIVQPKYDGVRCRAVPLENGEYILLSSEENVIFSVPHINEELKSLSPGPELDGELYRHELSFEEILSITSRTVNLHYEHKLIKFHVFDVIDDQPQHSRIATILGIRKFKFKHIEVSPFWLCDNLSDVKRTYDNVLSQGYEGIIIRNVNTFYERKRSTWVMKFKPKRKDTYEITGWNEEVSINGVPKGRLGSIICASEDGTTFSVSAGLDDDDRERLWRDRESLPGKSVIVHYQHLTNKKIPKGTFNLEVVE